MTLQKTKSIIVGLLLLTGLSLKAEDALDRQLPVRGFCIAAPGPDRLDEFIKFLEEELAPRAVNTLILRVDYNYQYTSHPELASKPGLSKGDVSKLSAACRKHQIRVIPQINLLGHQSWQRTPGNLLRVYPEFDETPWVQFPEKYAWPNPDRLYCKSYCPLHPKVHDVVFALVDELCNAFEADAFHAGLDEVFYIGEDKCPRCSGRDKAELFAGEVRLLRDHLHQKGCELWVWGDRFLDGKTTGLGEWEASMNGTERAVDLVPKDVIICDWHYERPDQTAVYFAMKGLKVITCPWNNPGSAVLQVQDVLRFRQHSTPQVRERILGVAQTVWSGSNSFLDRFYGKQKEQQEKSGRSESQCFIKMFEEISALTRNEPAKQAP
jgi:hypothetical protein